MLIEVVILGIILFVLLQYNGTMQITATKAVDRIL